MSPQITAYDRDAKAVDIAATLGHESAVIVRELLDPEVVDLLVDLLDPHLAREEPGGGEFYGNRTKVFGNLFARGREFSEHLLLNPLVLGVLDGILLPQVAMGVPELVEVEAVRQSEYEVLDHNKRTHQPGSDPLTGPNCHHYRVHASAAISVCGGGTLQPLHREMDAFFPFYGQDPRQPVCVVAVLFACTDYTLENGATQIVPESHLWEQTRLPAESEVARGVMPRGSALFWLGRTLHGLGANRTDEPRTGIFTAFSVDWLSQEENQFLAVPPELARTLPEKAQRLLGYRAGAIGWVGGLNSENLLGSGEGSPI